MKIYSRIIGVVGFVSFSVFLYSLSYATATSELSWSNNTAEYFATILYAIYSFCVGASFALNILRK